MVLQIQASIVPRKHLISSSSDPQVKYRKDFEESKGRGLRFLVDTPEVQRLKKTQDQISNVRPEHQVHPYGLHTNVNYY